MATAGSGPTIAVPAPHLSGSGWTASQTHCPVEASEMPVSPGTRAQALSP